jgi:hypothetical protein
MVSTWISPKSMKGTPSEIAGRGLVAVEAISKGEVVAVKGGHIVTSEQLRSMPERLQDSDVQITDDLHLVALTEDEYESVMLFINHSCEPNVGFAGNVVLVAMCDIDAGEELTTDYAMFDDYEGSMDCTCGRAAGVSMDATGSGPTCRSVIADTSPGTSTERCETTDSAVQPPDSRHGEGPPIGDPPGVA